MTNRMKTEKSLLPMLKKIKMLATDVDGVLTDSGMYYSEQGDELKKFNTRDGMGLVLLRNAGYKLRLSPAKIQRLWNGAPLN